MTERPEAGLPSEGASKQRLEEIKRQIEAGEYESNEKLDKALTRLLADLRGARQGARASRGDDSGGARP